MPFDLEVHTVQHFKGTINTKVEPEGLEFIGIFIFYQVRQRLSCLLHKAGFVDSDMHTTVIHNQNIFTYLVGFLIIWNQLD